MLSMTQYRAAVRLLRSYEGRAHCTTWWNSESRTEFTKLVFRGLDMTEGASRANEMALLAVAIGGQSHVSAYDLADGQRVIDVECFVCANERVYTADGERIEADEDDEDADDVAARAFGG